MKQNIFVCGPSGAGKSTSLRNLNPDKTIIINTERKALPFRGAGKFTKQVMVSGYQDFLGKLNKAITADAEVIVIDSFTSLTEQIYAFCKQNFNGFTVWDEYATNIYDILQMTKDSGKYVVFVGIDEPLSDESTGTITRHVKVEGKKMKGAIEKEFTCVLWAKVINDAGEIKHCFETNNDGHTTAKTPMEMFENRYIENDLNKVINTIEEYYQ